MFITPMLLEKREQPFDDSRYIYEPKIDGHRLILSIQSGVVRLYTRHKTEVTPRYPELHNVPIDDNTDVVLDGEVACIDPETGTIDFELITQRFMTKKEPKIIEAALRNPVVYYVFDILRYKGEDLRERTLMERKEILAKVITANNNFSPVISVEGAGSSLFQVIKEKKLEGIVAKKKTGKYVSRRSVNWIKIINYEYADVQIAGYRKNEFGWLLRYGDKSVGVLELAVPATHRNAFYGVSRNIIVAENRDFVYVEPCVKARVRFRNWTRAGMLRAPEFVDFVI